MNETSGTCIHTLGRPGNSLSTMVATWNWSSLTSSAMTWAAAPLCSFLLSWLLILTMSASLWVKSSYKTEVNWGFVSGVDLIFPRLQKCSVTIWLTAQSGIISLYLVASRALHDYSRPDSQWRHRQHCYNHPFWSGELGVHAQDDVLFIRDPLEDFMHTLGTQQNFLLLWILVNMLPLCVQLQSRASDTWLVAPTATVALHKSDNGKASGETDMKLSSAMNFESHAVSYDTKTSPKYLLLGNVLLSVLLLHSKFVVHLLPSFTDIFSFAQLVHMCQTFPGLPFRFHQDVFDLWIVL